MKSGSDQLKDDLNNLNKKLDDFLKEKEETTQVIASDFTDYPIK